MKKKDVVFTIGICIFMGVLWIVGELIMGLYIPVRPRTHLWWLIGVVSFTLVVNIWHSFIEDESGLKDPRREKYERKVNGRKNRKKNKKRNRG
jgi:hypothetical protein